MKSYKLMPKSEKMMPFWGEIGDVDGQNRRKMCVNAQIGVILRSRSWEITPFWLLKNSVSASGRRDTKVFEKQSQTPQNSFSVSQGRNKEISTSETQSQTLHHSTLYNWFFSYIFFILPKHCYVCIAKRHQIKNKSGQFSLKNYKPGDETYGCSEILIKVGGEW